MKSKVFIQPIKEDSLNECIQAQAFVIELSSYFY